MKWCPQGMHYVHVDDFGNDKARKDGKHPYCKPCNREYRAEYMGRGDNRTKQREYDRLRRQDPSRRAYLRALERVRKGRLAAGDVTMVDLTTLASQNGPNCALCGGPLNDDVTVEHKTPLARGGSHTLDNLALAHLACNMRKGRLTMAEWNARVAGESGPG